MKREDALKAFKREYSLDSLELDGENEYIAAGCRSGSDGLFSPRESEEDDDFPDFNDHLVVKFFKTYGFDVSTWDHEKGWFSIRFEGDLK